MLLFLIYPRLLPLQISPPNPSNPKHTPQALAQATETNRRVTQDIHEKEYQQALITIKDKIRESEGPDMKETMMDQIRQWFIECRSAIYFFVTASYEFLNIN